MAAPPRSPSSRSARPSSASSSSSSPPPPLPLPPPLLPALLLLSAAAAPAPASAAPPRMGPWPVENKSFKVPRLDATDPSVWVVYPVCNVSACPKYPLVSYAHGFFGGDIDLIGYANHFEQIASYGFVVAAPDACDVGCTDPSQGAPYTDCAGLPPLQPPLWPAWYGEQLKTIEWARNMTAAGGAADPLFATIDWAAGVGIAGHSMGGQATTMSAGAACAKRWDIRAAALIHPEIGSLPWGNTGSNMSVPVAAFTSSGDNLCPAATAEATMAAFNSSAQARTLPSALRNVVGWSHLEPVLGEVFENPLLATYTAAWLKVMLNQDRGEYYDLIYGSGPDRLCNSEPMVGCYVLNAPQ